MGTPEPGIYMGTRLSTAPGYLVREENGRKSQLSLSKMLRAADIPALTYEQVGAIKTLANLVVVLIRTLIAKDMLNQEFLEEGEYDLEAMIQSIEDMGGDYSMPDISVP